MYVVIHTSPVYQLSCEAKICVFVWNKSIIAIFNFKLLIPDDLRVSKCSFLMLTTILFSSKNKME